MTMIPIPHLIYSHVTAMMEPPCFWHYNKSIIVQYHLSFPLYLICNILEKGHLSVFTVTSYLVVVFIVPKHVNKTLSSRALLRRGERKHPRDCFSTYLPRFMRISRFLDDAHLPSFACLPSPSWTFRIWNFVVITPLLKNFPIYPSVNSKCLTRTWRM